MQDLALVNFDQLIKRLQFNLNSAKSAIELEEYKSTEEFEALEGYIHELKETIRKLEIAKEVAQKEVPTDEDVHRVMGITCYGNLGYCCALAKECLWRDSCRQALGIDNKTYIDIKEAVIWQLLERANKVNNKRALGASRKDV
jgi:hypothetical protein